MVEMFKIKSLSGKKIAIILVSIAILGTGTFFIIKRYENKTPEVKTATIQRDSVINSVSTTGKIGSNFDIDIKCKASGEISLLPFDISDTVKKGDLILKLNPVDEQRAVKEAEMTVAQTEASLAKAKQDLFNSTKQVGNSRKLAQASVESALLKLKDANTKLESVKALSLTGKKTTFDNLNFARIKAQELANKAEANKQLFLKGYISRIDYETSDVNAQQAVIDVKNAENKLKDQETSSNNDYQSALSNVTQAQIEVQNAQTRLIDQDNAVLNLKLKESDIKSMEARFESDKLGLQNALQRLSDTQVFSPIDGVVTNRYVQVGQIITSGISSVNQGTTILTISDLSRMFIMASVDESDIGKIKLGQSALITVDSFPRKKFEGKVKQIYSKGVNVSNVVTFTVKIEVLGEEKNLLKPEMTTNVEIFIAMKENVLTVPIEAVIKKRKKYFVEVKKDDKNTQQQREITVGISDYNKYEVINGLKEGEKVILNETVADNPWQRNNSGQRSPRIRIGGGPRH